MSATVRTIAAAQFADRVIRESWAEKLLTLAQLQSLNSIPVTIVSAPAAGILVIPIQVVAGLNIASVVFSGAITLDIIVGTSDFGLVTTLALGDGTAAVVRGEAAMGDTTDLTGAIGGAISVQSAADRTGGTGSSGFVFVKYATVDVSDLITIIT